VYKSMLHNDAEWIALTVNEKLLYFYIKAEYWGYRSNGTLRLSYREITRVTGMSSATISKGLKTLAKDGNFIKFDESKKGSNKRRTMYSLTWKHDDWMDKDEAKALSAESWKKAQDEFGADIRKEVAEWEAEENGTPKK
jgi:hypothetical protein